MIPPTIILTFQPGERFHVSLARNCTVLVTLLALSQPRLPRAHDGFGTVGHLQLIENIRNVNAHRTKISCAEGTN